MAGAESARRMAWISRGVKPRAAWPTSGPWSQWNRAARAASTGNSLSTDVKVRWSVVSGIGLLCGAVDVIRESIEPGAHCNNAR